VPALKNARHEKFALALSEGKSATEAYVLAGYKPGRQNAARLTTFDDIKARLAEIQAAAAKATEVTVASLLQELEDARIRANSLDQLSTAVRAIEAKAKVSGIMVQRIEERIEVGGPGAFDRHETAEEIAERVIEEYIGTEAQRYLFDEEQWADLIALTCQTLTDLGAAFERYRVDVIRSNTPADIRARELQARVRERQQQKRLPPPPAPE
jgi:midasin (ATPase involved in ribosome maturation)